MSTVNIAVVAGASDEEFVYIERCLGDWKCVNLPLKDTETGIHSIRETPTLAIIHALEDEKQTLGLCKTIRDCAQRSSVPILLAIDRYKITQGNAVKRIGNAFFILTPFDDKQLKKKAAELLADS